MEIKKISDKLNFDVESQCKHGTSSSKGGCKADCKKSKWVAASWLHSKLKAYRFLNCRKSTYYTCSWTCWW